MSTKASRFVGTAASVALVAGALSFAGYTDHRWREALRADEAAHAYSAYVETASAEQQLHESAVRAYQTGRYLDAKAAHDAAVADASATLTNATGKVDTTTLTISLPVLSLQGDTEYLKDTTAKLIDQTAALQASVDAWQAEQDRIAAEKAAAEEAARQAAAEQSYSDSSDDYSEPSAPAPESSSGVDATVYVYGWGWQDAIDACAGAVWYNGYGGAGLAEHWQCGGSSFPDWPGAIIDIPGVGLYESVGVIAMMDSTVLTSEDAPYGYADLFYQTCYGGDPHSTVFYGLNRIG